MKESIKAQRQLRHLKRASKILKQEYFALCRKDKLTSAECLFTSCYSDISENIARLLALRHSIPTDLSLAKEVISQSGNRLIGTEKIIMAISGVMAQRKVTSTEIETLSYTLALEMILSMPNALKSGDITRLLNMHRDIKSIGFKAITSSCDPLHSYLFELDETYRESDLETQKQYRQRVRDLSQGDEIIAAKELIEYSKMHAIDLSEALFPTFHRMAGKALTLIVCYLSIAVSLSLGASLLTLEWWVAPMLILPSLYAARSIVDNVTLFGQDDLRLWRFSETSDQLQSEKLAMVFHTVLSESVDINQISNKLKKLSSTENFGNTKVVCLLDLTPEQAPVTPEDATALNSVAEMIARLNENERGRYVAIVRKRTFSKSQEEYIGGDGKRGALLELSQFMQGGAHDFSAVFGDGESLIGTRFIVLAGDDCTPELNAASTLLRIAMHPCNLPKIKNGKVIKGYGIIAPSTQHKLESALASGFSRVFAIKPRRVDIFSGLFGEATFKGIGLVNTELYLQTVGRFDCAKNPSPEILEGEWLKCAKADDVKFYSAFPDIPQRFYRKLMHKVRASVYNLPYAFKRQFGLTSKTKLVCKFLSALVPLSILANMFLAFWLYPPSAVFAALLGLALWQFPLVFETLRSVIFASSCKQQFYSRPFSGLAWAIKHIAYSIVMLPTLAQKSLWAIITALVRGLTGKRIFNNSLTLSDPLSFYLLPMLIGLALFRSPGYSIRLLALFFALMPAVLALSEHESTVHERRLSFKESKDLTQYIADSWKFFNEYVTEADNDLPPKTVQFSPVYRIDHSTGPQEIGLYLLSCLGAYDSKLITAHALATRVEKCLDSVDKLEKYRGCLYKSYHTLNLSAESDIILSEDMGIYVSSLICLSEGLRKLGRVYDKAQILSERLDRIATSIDLSIFYDDISGLMCKSFNTATQAQSSEHHEHLMSASRLCSFYAIATQSVPKSHWQKLKRQTLKSGFISGLGSPNGSVKDFFLPEIFLKSPQGSVFHESLKFLLYVNKKLGLAKDLPFGLSECEVHQFRSDLGYRTQNLGAPKAATDTVNLRSYVVSPYSSFLALGFDAHACAENLLKLKKAGAYGNFGFFEAVDYTSNNSEEVVKSLSACHVGLIIASGVNALNKGIMQRRMTKNPHILGTYELLEERFLPAFKTVRKPKTSACESIYCETYSDISPSAPRIKLLNNGGYSLILCDCGTAIALRQGLCIYKMTREPSFNKRGIFAAVKTSSGVTMLDSPDRLTCEFSDRGVSYKKQCGNISASMEVCLHQDLPCEIRRFKLKNLSDDDIEVGLLIYLEPTLLKPTEDNTERKQLSLRLERDDRLKVITVHRADADCSQHLAIGFCEDIAVQSSFDKESVFSGKDDVSEVFENADSIAPSLVSEPKPCVFIKTKINLKAGAEQDVSLFILALNSADELEAGINSLRGRVSYHSQASTKALALAQLMLPSLVFCNDTLSLMPVAGLVPRVPIILLRLNGKNDDEKLSAFLSAYKDIRETGVSAQLAVLFNDGGKPEREHYSKLLSAAKQCDTMGLIYSQGGIIPIDEFSQAGEAITCLCELAQYTASDEIVTKSPERKPYKRISISKVSPDDIEVSEKVSYGGFNGNEYIITERPQVKWRHPLSNPVFGSVVDNASLGVTSLGDFKERLILELNGEHFDIINGSAAVFSPNFAAYKAVGDGFRSEVSVSVSQKGMCKRFRVKITSTQKCRLAYVFEANGKVVKNSGTAVIIDIGDKYAGASASKFADAVFNKENFFSGEWESDSAPDSTKFCALISELSGAEEVSFYLSFGASEEAVTKMPACFSPHQKQKALTKHERELAWAKYQLLNGRIYLGDGFGNYSFDGVLQDVCAIFISEPERCKAEILRCAYHQFSDGDAVADFCKGGKKGETKRTPSHEHLWLPLAVSEYVIHTGDFKFLDLGVRYFDAHSQKESVYEHCRRAVNFSLDKKGQHGLMLDGYERESVWLSEFFIIVLERFCEIARRKGDNMYSAQLLFNSKILREAIKAYCKDSSQYIGGYLPSGETWGSTKNEACKICLVPQVLAQFARLDEKFDKCALFEAYTALCDPKRGVTKLFMPAFDPNSETSSEETRYLPTGIKQNGGQISASAIWLAMALKQAGFIKEAQSIIKSLPPEERAKTSGYKQEPYYICGEIYANKNCYGQGAEPIFNSACGWYYKLLSENGGKESKTC